MIDDGCLTMMIDDDDDVDDACLTMMVEDDDDGGGCCGGGGGGWWFFWGGGKATSLLQRLRLSRSRCSRARGPAETISGQHSCSAFRTSAAPSRVSSSVRTCSDRDCAARRTASSRACCHGDGVEIMVNFRVRMPFAIQIPAFYVHSRCVWRASGPAVFTCK